MKKTNKKLTPFGWYGGKYYYLDWIYKNMPKKGIRSFVEPFCGSATVAINLPWKIPIITINDLDSEIVNFFRVLREKPEELIEMIELTCYSKEELFFCKEPLPEDISDVERARRFYMSVLQARAGERTSKSWAYSVTADQSKGTSRLKNKPAVLYKIAKILTGYQIEHSPALEVIERFDTDMTFFYLDPPYVKSTRVDKNAYNHEMDDTDHRKLAEVLNGIKGKAMIAGYPSDLYNELFAGWRREEIEVVTHASDSKIKSKRTEVMWLNYEEAAISGKRRLF